MRALIAPPPKETPVIPAAHPSAHMADIPMLQTATVGSAAGFLFPSEKRNAKRRGKLWLLLVPVKDCKEWNRRTWPGPNKVGPPMPAQWKG